MVVMIMVLLIRQVFNHGGDDHCDVDHGSDDHGGADQASDEQSGEDEQYILLQPSLPLSIIHVMMVGMVVMIMVVTIMVVVMSEDV